MQPICRQRRGYDVTDYQGTLEFCQASRHGLDTHESTTEGLASSLLVVHLFSSNGATFRVYHHVILHNARTCGTTWVCRAVVHAVAM